MKVYNIRTGKVPNDAVYVGRPTKWGNPYSHIKGKGRYHVATRAIAIARYKDWLWNHGSLVEEAQHELRGKSLVCWCAPLPCHAEVLMQAANETGILSESGVLSEVEGHHPRPTLHSFDEAGKGHL